MERQEKLQALRSLMSENGLDSYIIPSSDPHQNEYIPPCWQFRAWISGFTGSAGTVVVTADKAGLWTDSRYFIQAENQLKGSSIELFKLKVPHTPEHIPWLASTLKPGSKVGIDGRYFSMGMVQYMEDILTNAGHELITDIDIMSPVWIDQPALPSDPVYIHNIKFAGVTRHEKIRQVVEGMQNAGADYHLLTTLDDIAWLLNLRGNDISFCPLFLSFCVVGAKGTVLFINQSKLSPSISELLGSDNIEIKPYEAITSFLENLPNGSAILFSPEKVNYALLQSIPTGVKKIPGMNITTGLKAIKNKVEIDGLKQVMIKDGAAWVKTLYWIDHQVHSGVEESEWSVALKIAEFRAAQAEYRGESFHPISSYGWHGAVVHYSVTPQESLKIFPNGIFLLDSGGHYSDGTTDTTRTVTLAEPADQQKSDFTRALKGTLGVSMLRFPKGTKGYQMDMIARRSLWEAGLNYGHGTGHGVGFLLSVHEGPQTIGTSASGYLNVSIEPGMVTTVEPAIYREGSYGMRTENMTLVVEDIENEYGTFYRFETLTLAPIDRNLIDKSLLTTSEIEWLNSYHQRVYMELADSLNDEEKTWLHKATRPI